MFTRYSFILLLLTTAPLFSAIIEKPESEKTFFGLKASDFFVTHSFLAKPALTEIAFLGNIHNNDRYVLKQRTTDFCFTSIVREMVVASIAKTIRMRANDVTIIPVHYPFPGRLDPEKPATLHTFVPGVDLRELPEHYHKPYLKQTTKPERIKGLQKAMISDMARHPDLPILVAFDTFVADNDRHPGNILYDEESNHYFAIDMEQTFTNNIAQYAHALFELLIKEKLEQAKQEKKVEEEKEKKADLLSTEEINALKVYQFTLKTLIPLYPPETIFARIAQARIEAGIENHEESGEIEKALQQTIQDNYDSCIQTVASLDVLLKNYEKLSEEIPNQEL